MIFFFRDADLPMRSALFEKMVRTQYCVRVGGGASQDLSNTQETHLLEAFLGLGMFERDRFADTNVFVGLCCAPEHMLGDNVLICTRPLKEELAALAQDVPELEALSENWWQSVLANFRKCIFLDALDMIASLGFAPWIEMSLVPLFPIQLAPRSNIPTLNIFQHGRRTEGSVQELCDALPDHIDRRVWKYEGITGDPPKVGGVDVHVGFGEIGRPAPFAPQDSIINGSYCFIMGLGTHTPAVSALSNLCWTRSYSEIYPAAATEDVVARTLSAMSRLEHFKVAGLSTNPEVGRFSTQNQRFIESHFSELSRQIET